MAVFVLPFIAFHLALCVFSGVLPFFVRGISGAGLNLPRCKNQGYHTDMKVVMIWEGEGIKIFFHSCRFS